MGNKSRFRQSFDAQGNAVKNPHWRRVRDMASAGRPTYAPGLHCSADLVHVRQGGHFRHFRRALPVLWNSSKAGTFRNAKPLNSQL